MAFCRKVDDGTRLVLSQQLGHCLAISNISLHKDVARIDLKAGQVLQIARVGQLVNIDDWLIRCSRPIENKVCANEARAAGNKDYGNWSNSGVNTHYRDNSPYARRPRATNTTLDTSLLRLVVLLYCLRLRVSSPTQIFDLLGAVSRS